MSKITTSLFTSQKDWEKFTLSHNESSFLQSWWWGEFNQKLGKKIHRISFHQNEKIIGTALCIIEEAKRGKHMLIPGGPILDWNDTELVNLFFFEIRKIGNIEKCIFVRIRPQLEQSEKSLLIFKKHNTINSLVHLHAELTNQLDISIPEENLLSNMRKTTRYEIKKAIKEGIHVTKSGELRKIKNFYDLQLLTAQRQKFIPFSFEYLNEQFKVFSEKNYASFFEAYLGQELLAQAFVIFYNNEAVYHYGASTEANLKHPGAYLLQWEIIKEAKRRGFKKYNFWGVAPIDNPAHRFFKISVFKRGFGGSDFAYLHAQDLVLNPILYSLNYLVEFIRKKVRKI